MKEFIVSLWTQYAHLLPGIGRRLVIAVLIIIGGRIVTTASEKVLKKAATSSKIRIDNTVASVLHLVIKYGVVIICALMILEIFGFNTTSLVALLGTLAVTIGMSLRNTLSNIASGIILFVLRPFQQGDFIEFGPTVGTVKALDLFSTVIETSEGVRISVPNSNLWGPPIKNYSQNKKRRLEFAVLVPYTEPLETAITVMKRIGKEEKLFLKDPEPLVYVRSVGEAGTTIVLSAWANRDDLGSINQDVVKIIKERIDAAGLQIPFPRGEITIRSELLK